MGRARHRQMRGPQCPCRVGAVGAISLLERRAGPPSSQSAWDLGRPFARLGARWAPSENHGENRATDCGPRCQPRYSAPGPPPSQSPSEAYESVAMQSLVQISIGGGRRGTHARAGRRPRSSQRRRCSLRTRAEAAVVAEGAGGVETRPLARPPPKGTQKKSLDAAVA